MDDLHRLVAEVKNTREHGKAGVVDALLPSSVTCHGSVPVGMAAEASRERLVALQVK